jgi:hypothetical protein
LTWNASCAPWPSRCLPLGPATGWRNTLSRFVVRALGYGGLAFEDDKPDTLAEAMASLERGLAEYFKREGIDLEE